MLSDGVKRLVEGANSLFFFFLTFELSFSETSFLSSSF